jgi:hypothetical protein
MCIKNKKQFSLQNVYLGVVPFLVAQRHREEQILVVQESALLLALFVLRKHINYAFSILTCISGVDLLGFSYRF